MNTVLCRLCLMKCEDFFGMYTTSPSGTLRCLPKIIRECISLEVSDVEPSFVSKFICNECIYKLELFYTFRQQSLKSQEYFNGLLLYYQQSVPCSSKLPIDSTSEPVDTMFEIEAQPQTHLEQSANATNELVDINFSGNEFMLDETEKNQLSKDYDDIIRSLQKDDLDFTTNDEELVMKHDLEISMSKNDEHQIKDVPVQQECADHHNYLQHHNNDPANVSQPAELVTDCYSTYDTLSITNTKDVTIDEGGLPDVPDDDLNYNDFVGIQEEPLNENRDSPLSESHMQEVIDDEYTITTEKVHSADNQQHSPRMNSIQNSTFPLPRQNDSYFPMECHEETESAVEGNGLCTIDSKTPSNDKTCEICNKTFRTRQKLTIHRNTHLRLAPFKCTFEGCEKAFKSRIGLEEHLARHTNSFEYTCDMCSKGFLHRSYLSAHRRAHNTDRSYHCSLCRQSFKSKQALLDHKNRHLGVKFACELCDKQYAKNSLLQVHIRQHHTDREDAMKSYPCVECGKSFTSKSYLNVHMRIHRNERPFVCEVCNKGHVTHKDLVVHMTTHTGEKPLVCDICGKRYARRGALDWHRRTHTRERPYICDICGQTFTQATPLQTHRRLHDAVEQKKDSTNNAKPNSTVSLDHDR